MNRVVSIRWKNLIFVIPTKRSKMQDDDINAGKYVTAVHSILGDKQWVELRRNGTEVGDLPALLHTIMKAQKK